MEEKKQRSLEECKDSKIQPKQKGYQQNKLFKVEQKRLDKEINCEITDEKLIIDNKDYQNFQSDIWSIQNEQKKDDEQQQELKQTVVCPKQARLFI